MNTFVLVKERECIKHLFDKLSKFFCIPLVEETTNSPKFIKRLLFRGSIR